MTDLTNQQKAQATAIQRAAASLATIDLTARCAQLGLPAPASDGTLSFRMLGQDLRITPPSFQIENRKMGGAEIENPSPPSPVRPADSILALHYLLCSTPVTPTGQLITFRDLPGGPFYFGPFTARTTRPLLANIGNNLDLLRQRLTRFDTQYLPASSAPAADLTATIHALGPIHVTLVYHQGDAEFPPTAELLFDSCIKRVYVTEDVTVLASRICLSLLQGGGPTKN